MSDYVRFARRARFEHASILGLFVILCLTGFPQKFFPGPGVDTLVGLLGGIDTARLLHRAAGIAFAAICVLHLTATIVGLFRPGAVLTMAPSRRDVQDAVQALRHELGAGGAHPRYDRYDYRQKFEYWGLLLGGVLMIGTGFVLLFPTRAALLLSGQVIPAAKAAHGNEGLMAFLVVLVWHVVHAVFSPEVFPADRTIFTGRMSVERMQREHPLELARARGENVPPAGPLATPRSVALAPLQAGLFAMVLPALGLVALGERLLARARGRA